MVAASLRIRLSFILERLLGSRAVPGSRFLYLRLLRASLILGALYDAVFAALMVAAPEATARLLRVPLPGERFYLHLMAVLLLMMALLYMAAARDPRRYATVTAVAIAGRLAGAAAFWLAAWDRPDLSSLWWLGAADFAFGAAHAVAWLPLRE
jgi:hypothetical protein